MQALVYTGTMVKMALEAKNINRSSDTRLSRGVSHVFVCERNTHTQIFHSNIQSKGSMLNRILTHTRRTVPR